MNALTLTRLQAAELCGLSPSGFDVWVRRGIVPPPIMGTKRWSRVQLERALAGLPWVPPEANVNLQDRGQAEYEAWSADNDERDKHRPLHGLNQREERTLRSLVKLQVSNGRDIAGAGLATFDALCSKGLAQRVTQGWEPTVEGITEIGRTDTWLNWHKR
ncbi:hypothetical protein [Devosia sp. YR412]|uniref:hypothetical protein n=1 Tax=Devosia sp. YR412 TaxID=1881030 RepID=UPI001113A90C|nr:hypothetical protein [Devosia sp. YR412]